MTVSFISRKRLLPYHGTVKVEVGDFVQATDVVAELDYVPGALSKIQATRQLDIQPTALSAHMQRAVGDKVEQDDLLASSVLFGEPRQVRSTTSGYIGLVSNSLGTIYVRQPVPVGSDQPVHINLLEELGVSKVGLIGAVRVRPPMMVTPGQVLAMTPGIKARILLSPVYGRVESISDGVITIMPTHARTRLQAYLSGQVQQVIPHQGIVVQAYAHVISGVYGVGGESGGEIFVAAEPNEELKASAVSTNWRGKIVVAGRTVSLELLQAATEVGCAGVVVAHLSSAALAKYVGTNSRPGMAGEDELLMPVMLTERFSPTAMRHSVWQELASLQGRHASMSGRTHIRAGLLRPEVVVCETVWPTNLPQVESTSGTVRVGDLVRILRGTNLDQIGRIIELPAGRQPIATGARLRVAKVACGEYVVTEPVANLLKLETGGMTQ